MKEEKICSVCMKDLNNGEAFHFVGTRICPRCESLLSLSDLKPSEGDKVLKGILDAKGLSILDMVTSLLDRTPRETGWKVLGMAPFIGDQIDDIAQRSIMESALILMGSSIIRTGAGSSEDEEVSQELVTLLLVIGQYLDLSVMGRISAGKDLHRNDRIEELILVEEHNHLLFALLKDLDPGEDPQRSTIVARAMSMLVR